MGEVHPIVDLLEIRRGKTMVSERETVDGKEVPGVFRQKKPAWEQQRQDPRAY